MDGNAPPSLFPVSSSASFSATSTPNAEWLSNPSFSVDLSIINDAVSKYQTQQKPQHEEEEEEEEKISKIHDARPHYNLVESPASDDEIDIKRKKKKRKKRNELLSNKHYGFDSRKPGVSSTSSKEYYFDSHGDADNLAFGSLYRMDVARYKPYNSRKTSGLYHFRSNQYISSLSGENDVDALDNNLKFGGRYWSPKYTMLEHHKNLKRIRIPAAKTPLPTLVSEFIPLSDESSSSGSLSWSAVVEESGEDEVLRKTREFNKLTRESPHDEKAWLAFAELQDKVANMQTQKGARLQILEKKISILEKASELNPDSEELLLSLMNAYRSRDNTDLLISRWEKILVQHSGSYKLWREFLQVVKGEFSRFKVSEMRKMYTNAIGALFGSCRKQFRQAEKAATAADPDTSIVQLELCLVDTFTSLCRFEWQAGYQELASSLFQAEIEYSLFCPSLLLTEQSKQRLFEYFWNSNGARVGEESALGWATWLEKEEEQRKNYINKEFSSKAEEGGWTGWSEPLSKNQELKEAHEPTLDDVVVESSSDGPETDELVQEDDTDALLKMLGIDAAAANGEVKDPETWSRWSKEELARGADQWLPLHAASDDGENDEHLLRVILYEDVSDYLFSINSKEARQSLISQFIDFFGGRQPQWISTNSSSWAERSLSLESLPFTILEDLHNDHGVLTKDWSGQMGTSLVQLLGSSDDISMQTNMMKFLRNASLLFLSVFPQNYKLEEAILVAEELTNTQMSSSSSHVTPCRALAKNLIKSNRQDVLLCGVYARREAVFGNIDHARKVFDMALLSSEGLPSDIQTKASILYLWYAEVELAHGSPSSAESASRAIHILSCFGCGAKYSPYRCQPSSLQQLRARQGFKELMKTSRSAWAHGIIDDHSTALICSAALFEDLTSGWSAAIEIFDQAFTMVLPERRRKSYHLEFLFNYYVDVLWKHSSELRPKELWDCIVKGLQVYPFSAFLYSALVKNGCLRSSPNKLRWILDDFCQKEPSVVVWLVSLEFELSSGGTKHRVRALLERGLENEKLRNSVILWRCYIAYECDIVCNPSAARKVYFRAIHACPWSKRLWLDGFLKLSSVLTPKELSDLQEVMRDKEINLRTDIYEILLQDEMEP